MIALGVVSFLIEFVWSRLVLLLASVLGDVVHAFLHWADDADDVDAAARPAWLRPALRFFGGLHRRHHVWIDRGFAVHPERFVANVIFHQVPEQLMQVGLCAVVVRALDLDVGVWLFCVAHLGLRFVDVLRKHGLDRDHVATTPLVRPRGGAFVDAPFHALHHVFPRHFLSARVVVVDRVLGTLVPIRHQRVLVIGTSRFATELAAACAAAGAVVDAVAADVDNDVLKDVDVLVCAHDADRYVDVVTRAQRARAKALAPLFLFTVGESPAWRAAAPLLVGERTVWRTLLRGPVLGGARALWWMRRGVWL